MRLWSLHPRYLDRQGLTACWREALLAQAVLAGRTRGYTKHPQLQRFREAPDALAAVGDYLAAVADEAQRRGYRYDRSKIESGGGDCCLSVTAGQLAYEWAHLAQKVGARSPLWLDRLGDPVTVEPHPIFTVVAGAVCDWEVMPDGPRGGLPEQQVQAHGEEDREHDRDQNHGEAAGGAS